jgi:hypothetical protein
MAQLWGVVVALGLLAQTVLALEPVVMVAMVRHLAFLGHQ